MKSFSVLKSRVGSFVQDTSSGLGTLIGYWANNRYMDIVNSYDWEQLYHTQSFTASSAVSSYALDENTERLIFVHDRTNDGYADVITEQEYLQSYYDEWDEAGTPDVAFLTSECVKAQPGSAQRLVVKSSSTADTTQTVLIRGLSSTVGEVVESVTLNGTTAVTAANSFSQVLGLSKSASASGQVRVYENDGSTLLAVLAPESLMSRYKILNLHPIPDADASYLIRTKRVVLPMANDYDYPIIDGVADIIEVGALADAWRYKRQFAKANAIEAQYQVMKSDRIHREVAQPSIMHQFIADPLNRDEGIL